MLRYALRRLITSLVTLFLVITLTFFLMQTVPSGGPFLGENANPEITARLLAKYGYDQPLLTQYVHYLRDLFVGDMGFSMVVKSGRVGHLCHRQPLPALLPDGLIACSSRCCWAFRWACWRR